MVKAAEQITIPLFSQLIALRDAAQRDIHGNLQWFLVLILASHDGLLFLGEILVSPVVYDTLGVLASRLVRQRRSQHLAALKAIVPIGLVLAPDDLISRQDTEHLDCISNRWIGHAVVAFPQVSQGLRANPLNLEQVLV
jgi:hypothetical protein